MPKTYWNCLAAGLLASVVLNGGETAVVAGLNRFALATYGELAHTKGNLILSPFNIASALSMAMAGARGDTAAEMARVLHSDGSNASYNSALAQLVDELAKVGNANGNQLLMANNIWLQQGLPVMPEFRRTMDDMFRAPLTPVDFRAATEAARQQINRWTEEHTKDKIKNLFGPGSLSSDARMVLTSAIYFNGKWESPFRPANTHPDTFHLGDGGAVQTQFMNQTGTFGYRDADAVQILEMRYQGAPLAFDILLPKQADGLGEVERGFTPENLAGWFEGLTGQRVAVTVPKFRSEAEFSLRNTLSKLGMSKAFSAAADFSGIDGRRDLMLSRVVHKAFVDVSEEGTEAAAATGAMMTLARMAQPETKVFRADHPFVYLIRDSRSGAILFAGRLVNPKS